MKEQRGIIIFKATLQVSEKAKRRLSKQNLEFSYESNVLSFDL